jgi:hypothetical protein
MRGEGVSSGTTQLLLLCSLSSQVYRYTAMKDISIEEEVVIGKTYQTAL